MPVAIVGAHRSGTSMISQSLHLAGLYLGDTSDLLAAAPDNPEGYWENRQFVQINDALLNQVGSGWDCPPAQSQHWSVAATPSVQSDTALLLRAFADREPWGWKDPRTSITLPFWLSLLADLKVVVCVRNPLEVALSLGERNGLSLALGLNLWLAYNESILRVTRPDQRIVVDYATYSENSADELCRLLRFLGIQPSDKALQRVARVARTDLRHHRLNGTDLRRSEVAGDVVRLYESLCKEACVESVTVEAPGTGSRQAYEAGVYRREIGRVNHARLEAELLRQRAVALQAALDGKSSEVDGVRREYASVARELESVMLEHDAATRALTNAQATVSDLHGQVAALDSERLQLLELIATRAAAEARERRLHEAERRRADTELGALRRQLATLELIATRVAAEARERELREAERQRADTELGVLLRRQLASLEQQLAELQTSTAWGVVLLLWRVRTLLVPHGSRRDHTLWRFICAFRWLAGRRQP
jgi:hypothetical protein